MASSVAWLDTSEEQRRKANEIVGLFSEREGRDELGVGTVRDALSNTLFPGTSVLFTRARYCLFVPWCFQEPTVVRRRGREHLAAAENAERRLVTTLIEEEPGSGAGVIGRRVGRDVRTLPRDIYWVALSRWGIVQRPGMHLLGLTHPDGDIATELDRRVDSDWHPDIPGAPSGFPRTTGTGFALTAPEAEWLRDRILTTCAGTALADLLSPAGDSGLAADQIRAAREPWEFARLQRREDVRHAELFSLLMHGASLVYNLLVAELCEQEELTTFDGRVEEYRVRLDEWSERIHSDARVGDWALPDFWELVTMQSPQPMATRHFIDSWITTILDDGADGAADNMALRRMVENRERRKGKQSRITNPRMLGTWSGASAADRLTFRWGTVSRLSDDILTGVTVDA